MSALPAAVVKGATHALHTETEQLLLPKLSSIHSTDDYARILKMFYGYFLPVEEKIQHHITTTDLPDIKQRRNAAAILHDLKNVGKTDHAIPACTDLPEIESHTQAFGALYVLEGSTLGGTMIAKMLLKNSSVTLSDDSTTFFAGYKAETGSKWKGFLEAFNQQPDVDGLVTSANETFLYLKRWIQHTLYNDNDPEF